MKDFEASAEPLQECLNVTELAVQESSTRLHDLTAKKMELNKLQVNKKKRYVNIKRENGLMLIDHSCPSAAIIQCL